MTIPKWVPSVSKFNLERLLGEGTWKGVIKAKLKTDGSDWALKFLNMSPLAEELMTSRGITPLDVLTRETMGGNIPHHQNIAYGYVEHSDNGTPYLRERFIPGVQLGEYIDANPNMDIVELLHIATQIATCLSVYHTEMSGDGMAHLDFKPANMIYDPKKIVVLTDNGLASMGSGVIGNGSDVNLDSITDKEYIFTRPPEWFLEEGEQNKAVDVWSFGSIMYKMFTGKYFFEEEFEKFKDPKEFMRYLMDTDNAWSVQLSGTIGNSCVPEVFRGFLIGCLSTPEKRYQNGVELMEGLNTAIAKYEKTKPAARIKKWSMVSAGIAALLAVTAVGAKLNMDKRSAEIETDYGKRANIIRLWQEGYGIFNHSKDSIEWAEFTNWKNLLQEKGADRQVWYSMFLNPGATHQAIKKSGSYEWSDIKSRVQDLDFHLYKKVQGLSGREGLPKWRGDDDEFAKLEGFVKEMRAEGVYDTRIAFVAYLDNEAATEARTATGGYDYNEWRSYFWDNNRSLWGATQDVTTGGEDAVSRQTINRQRSEVRKKWDELEKTYVNNMQKQRGLVSGVTEHLNQIKK